MVSTVARGLAGIELTPRLRDATALDLHALYVARFEGYAGLETVHRHTQNPEGDRPIVRATRHALDSALLDLRLLASAVQHRRKFVRTALPVALDGALVERTSGDREVDSQRILAELYWRVRDGWEDVPAAIRRKVVADLRLVPTQHDGEAPRWDELLALLEEVQSLNSDMGDGDVLLGAFDELIARFEAAGAKPERFVRASVTEAVAELAPRAPPPRTLTDAPPAVVGVARVVNPGEGVPAAESADPHDVTAKIHRLVDALVSRGLVELGPDASIDAIADRFTHALEAREVEALTELDDWLLEQPDVEEVFFDDRQLLALSTELGLIRGS
jgi:hypothetical protein